MDTVLVAFGLLHRLPTKAEYDAGIEAYKFGGGDERIAELFLESDAYAATI